MSRRQTNADLVFKLPAAIAESILRAIQSSMTPAQRQALTARQAAAVLEIATDAAKRVAEILEPDPVDREFDFDKG